MLISFLVRRSLVKTNGLSASKGPPGFVAVAQSVSVWPPAAVRPLRRLSRASTRAVDQRDIEHDHAMLGHAAAGVGAGR